MYSILANLVAIAHGVFLLLFLVAVPISLSGQLYRYRAWQWLVWIWMIGKTISYFALGGCILTFAEQYLRNSGEERSYSIGFIEHYFQIVGITLSDIAVVWLVVTPMVILSVSELYWWYRYKSTNPITR